MQDRQMLRRVVARHLIAIGDPFPSAFPAEPVVLKSSPMGPYVLHYTRDGNNPSTARMVSLPLESIQVWGFITVFQKNMNGQKSIGVIVKDNKGEMYHLPSSSALRKIKPTIELAMSKGPVIHGELTWISSEVVLAVGASEGSALDKAKATAKSIRLPKGWKATPKALPGGDDFAVEFFWRASPLPHDPELAGLPQGYAGGVTVNMSPHGDEWKVQPYHEDPKVLPLDKVSDYLSDLQEFQTGVDAAYHIYKENRNVLEHQQINRDLWMAKAAELKADWERRVQAATRAHPQFRTPAKPWGG